MLRPDVGAAAIYSRRSKSTREWEEGERHTTSRTPRHTVVPIFKLYHLITEIPVHTHARNTPARIDFSLSLYVVAYTRCGFTIAASLDSLRRTKIQEQGGSRE